MSALRIAPADDYAVERARFLAEAESLGAAIEHHQHPLAGPDGKPLFTDVARLGPAPGVAHTVVMITSGVHGAEGHTGSALQALLMADGHLTGLAPGVAVVLTHAVNPFGMAWDRRVDHDNIDVNRNFIDFSQPAPENPGYEDISPLLNPVDFSLDDATWLAEMFAYGEKVGMAEMFHAFSGGQYQHPKGIQFGGMAESWSRRTLESIWSTHAAGAEAVIHLDVHTGLGPCGILTTFQTADAEEAAAQAAAEWFPTVLRADRSAAMGTPGVVGVGMDATIGGATPLVVPVVLEWGTHDETVVAAAVRADNWLHNYGSPNDELGLEIRSRTRQAFSIDDDSWRETVATEGTVNLRAALDAAASRPGSQV